MCVKYSTLQYQDEEVISKYKFNVIFWTTGHIINGMVWTQQKYSNHTTGHCFVIISDACLQSGVFKSFVSVHVCV